MACASIGAAAGRQARHGAGAAHQVSTVSSSFMAGAACLTGVAARRATAGRTAAAGANAEHEPRRATKMQTAFICQAWTRGLGPLLAGSADVCPAHTDLI